MGSVSAVPTGMIPAFTAALLITLSQAVAGGKSPDYLECSVIICNQLLLHLFKLLYHFLELPLCRKLLPAVLLCQRGNGCLKFCYDLKRKQEAQSLWGKRHVFCMFLYWVQAWHWQTLQGKLNTCNYHTPHQPA